MAGQVKVLDLQWTRIEVVCVNATAMSLVVVIVMERLARFVVIGGSVAVKIVFDR